MEQPRTVLVTTRSFGSGDAGPAEQLRRAGLEVVHGDPDHRLPDLAEYLTRCIAWIAGVGPVTADHLAAAPGLRIVARYGVGVDAVDLAAARARGIRVTNTPGANARSVAEHTVALLLATLRHVASGDREVRAGRWPTRRGREVGALTVGLVGFGRVGEEVGGLLVCFGAEVLAHDPGREPGEIREVGVRPSTLDELLTAAEVVSLHRPPGERSLVDAGFLARLRPGAILLNTARAALVDPDAVAIALEEGRLSAYGDDVTCPAPEDRLAGAPNTVFTPHLGAATTEAIDRMGSIAAEEVLRTLRGEPALHPVTP